MLPLQLSWVDEIQPGLFKLQPTEENSEDYWMDLLADPLPVTVACTGVAL